MAGEELTLGQRIWRMANQLAQPMVTPSLITQRWSVSALDFGPQLSRRYETFGVGDLLGSQIAQRFATQASQSSAAELPLSIPPRSAPARAQWSGPRWPQSPPSPNLARMPAPVIGRMPGVPVPMPSEQSIERIADPTPESQDVAQPLDLSQSDTARPADLPDTTPSTVARSGDMPEAAQAAQESADAGMLGPDTAQLPVASDAPAPSRATMPRSANPLIVSRMAAEAVKPASATQGDLAPTLPGVRSEAVSEIVPQTVESRPAMPRPGEALRTADLTLLQPTTLRSTTLLRRLPADPLTRMGLGDTPISSAPSVSALHMSETSATSVRAPLSPVARSTAPHTARVASANAVVTQPMLQRRPSTDLSDSDVVQPPGEPAAFGDSGAQAPGSVLIPPLPDIPLPLHRTALPDSSTEAQQSDTFVARSAEQPAVDAVWPGPSRNLVTPPSAVEPTNSTPSNDPAPAPSPALALSEPVFAQQNELIWREPIGEPLPLPDAGGQAETTEAGQDAPHRETATHQYTDSPDVSIAASPPEVERTPLPVVIPIEPPGIDREFAELPFATPAREQSAGLTTAPHDRPVTDLLPAGPDDHQISGAGLRPDPPVTSSQTVLPEAVYRRMPESTPSPGQSLRDSTNTFIQSAPTPVFRMTERLASLPHQLSQLPLAIQRAASPTLFDPGWQPNTASQIMRSWEHADQAEIEQPYPAQRSQDSLPWEGPVDHVRHTAGVTHVRAVSESGTLPFGPTIAGQIRRIQAENPLTTQAVGLPGIVEATATWPASHASQAPQALELLRSPAADIGRLMTSVQRVTESDPQATAPQSAVNGSVQGGVASAQANQPNIEQIARHVYDHLRRRLLIEQERFGRLR